MRRCAVSAAVLACVLCWTGLALADNTSVLTAGIGGGVGYQHVREPGSNFGKSYRMHPINLRLKGAWFLGLDYAYDLNYEERRDPTTDRLQFGAQMRLTPLIYAIPTEPVAVYVGMGIGGGSVGDLFSFTEERNSYHGGIGMEVHLNEHITIDASFYMIVPGVRSVERHVEIFALTAAEARAAGEVTGAQPEMGDFVDIRNFELTIRLFAFL